jgi:small subunit ribosomal protein S17
MDKTVVVAVEIRKAHRIYKKVMRLTKKVYAHDESNSIKEGSLVRLVESKPMSKTKRWAVEEVIESVGNRVLNPVSAPVNPHPDEDTEDEAAPDEPPQEVEQ